MPTDRSGIEVPGGLVGQQDQRPVDEGPGDRHPLLLASRELAGEAVHLAGQPDQFQDGGHLAVDYLGALAYHLQREGHVLGHRLLLEELEVLEHIADVAPEVGHPPSAEPADVAAGHEYPAVFGHVLAVEQADERGLAGAGRTHQEDELPLADVDGHIAQGHHVALEDLRDLLHLDHQASPPAAGPSEATVPSPLDRAPRHRRPGSTGARTPWNGSRSPPSTASTLGSHGGCADPSPSGRAASHSCVSGCRNPPFAARP